MSLTDPTNPAAKEKLLERTHHTSFRNWENKDNTVDPSNPKIGKIFSEWITLKGGHKYYFESPMNDFGGEGHWTVGVEINPSVPAPANNYNLKPG